MNTQFTEILQEQTIQRLSGTTDGERVVRRFFFWPRKDVYNITRWLEWIWCYEEFIGGYVGHGVMAGSKWHRTPLFQQEPVSLRAFIASRQASKKPLGKPHIGGQMAVDFVLGLLKETDPVKAAEDLLQHLQPWTAGPEYTVGPVDYRSEVASW